MNNEIVDEHNRLFRRATELIKDEIPLHQEPNPPKPGWLLRFKLRHAIRLYKRVLKLNPRNWSAMWFVGKVYQRFRNMSEALKWFERAHQIDPSQPDVVREASICAMEIGRHDAARTFALCAIQIQPNDPGLHANLALAYLLEGRMPDAQEAIGRALAGDSSDKVSQLVQEMLVHFVSKGRLPPTKAPDLRKYWHEHLRSVRFSLLKS